MIDDIDIGSILAVVVGGAPADGRTATVYALHGRLRLCVNAPGSSVAALSSRVAKFGSPDELKYVP